MDMMDVEGQINEWKKKYENSEKNLATLKKLAHKGKEASDVSLKCQDRR